MQLLPHQRNVSALRDLVCEALELLTSAQLELLVERYGYARAFIRNSVFAVRADLAKALQEAAGSALLTVASNELPVVYYQDNDTGLRAAIDCAVPSLGGRCVWISFVVTGSETEQFLTLEDICAEPSPDC